MMPPGYYREAEIKAAVEEVEKSLAPRVKWIRYKIDQDFGGDWAVYFQVLLSDEVSASGKVHETMKEVRRQMDERLDFFGGLGLFPYFSLRTESEQKRLLDPAWA
jgi:hypothetical protein